MLPPSWKADAQKAVEETISSNESKRQADQDNAAAKIAASIETLRDAQDRQTSHQDCGDKKNRALNVVAIGLLFVTVYFTYKTWSAMRDQVVEMQKVYGPIVKSANAARDAADEAKKQVGVAIDTERRQLRAYVHLSTTNIPKIDINASPFEIVRHVKNYGVTPAYHVHMAGGLSVYPSDFGEQRSAPSDVQISSGEQMNTYIAPGDDLVISIKFPPDQPQTLSDQQKQMITWGPWLLFAYGAIRYDDAFGLPHTTTFRLQYGGADDVRLGRMNWSAEGNDAN